MASTGTTEFTDQYHALNHNSFAEKSSSTARRDENERLRNELVNKLKLQRVKELEAQLANPCTDLDRWQFLDELYRFKEPFKQLQADSRLSETELGWWVTTPYHDSYRITKGTVMARIYQTLSTDDERKRFIMAAYDYISDARCEILEYHWPTANRQP